MDATEKKSVFRRFTNAVRPKSLRRGRLTASQKVNITWERTDSGFTDLNAKKSTSLNSEDKFDVGKNCAIFKVASGTAASDTQSVAQSNQVQEQSNLETNQTNAESTIVANGIVGDSEIEYFDLEPTLAAAEFANSVIEEAFKRDPTLIVGDVADVTTVTEITKTVETKRNDELSKLPVQIQTEKVETKMQLETKTDVRDFVKTVEKSTTNVTDKTASKKEEKIILGPVKAQWMLKLDSKGRTKRPANWLITTHHKRELLPQNLPAGISDKSGFSSQPPANFKPGRRYR
jgi:hypothetical protein